MHPRRPALLAVAVLAVTASAQPQSPITAEGRLRWFAVNTVGPASLAGGVVSSAWGTLYNSPREYGPHWEGFGKRYGMRLTGISTNNAIEASMGAVWGEDPRYIRAEGAAFKTRVFHAIKMTFLAYKAKGRLMPAYARYIGISGNNFLSNTWRADSEATWSRAGFRIGMGFLGRMGANAFKEFWPDVSQRLRGHKRGPRR
jgi:hypothetical protein